MRWGGYESQQEKEGQVLETKINEKRGSLFGTIVFCWLINDKKVTKGCIPYLD